MLSIPHPTSHVQPAEAVAEGLLERLGREGWEGGPPPHITLETLKIDTSCLSRGRCSRCRRRGRLVKFLHKGTRYQAVAICTHCYHAEG